jgi:hypothetical protein
MHDRTLRKPMLTRTGEILPALLIGACLGAATMLWVLWATR